ncbi:MAG: hypothetical protein ACOCRZ_05750 [Halothermotrichaceae bacterium]
MPFGYSDKIFKYPAVQYIPLDKYNTLSKNNNPNINSNPHMKLYTDNENNNLNKKLSYLGITQDYNIKKNQLGLLIHNAEVDIIQYRGHEVIMVGKKKDNSFEVFTITKKYFYKDSLGFILYDGTNSKKMDYIFVNKI